jgi:hypothetical protein
LRLHGIGQNNVKSQFCVLGDVGIEDGGGFEEEVHGKARPTSPDLSSEDENEGGDEYLSSHSNRQTQIRLVMLLFYIFHADLDPALFKFSIWIKVPRQFGESVSNLDSDPPGLWIHTDLMLIPIQHFGFMRIWIMCVNLTVSFQRYSTRIF